jgi:hypothetical protein
MIVCFVDIGGIDDHHCVLIELTGHKKTMTYNVGNRGHGLGQAQTCGGVKLVTGIPIIPLDNWSSIQQYI